LNCSASLTEQKCLVEAGWIGLTKKIQLQRKICIAKTGGAYYHRFCSYGNYMSAFTSSFLKTCTVTCALFLGYVSGFAAELTLQKVSNDAGMVSYNLSDLHTKARALYVSSGNDLAQANSMIDNQPTSVYSFALNDATPAVIVDLGKVATLRRISATYSQRHVGIDFFVLQSLPGSVDRKDANLSGLAKTGVPQKLHLDAAALAKLTPVGSVLDEGTGRAAVDFPEMTGRYILVRWAPTHQERSFDVAEISVVGKAIDSGLTIAAVSAATRANGNDIDAKDIDAKDMGAGKDAKEIPSEGPPAEGPAVGLPQPPPFVFAPLVEVTSP
jgi:hypothetical protein